MRLLFVQSGPVVAFDDKGNVYVNSNDDQSMWRRYRKYCDELGLLLRDADGKVYSKSELLSKFFPFNTEFANIVSIPNIFKPYKNFFNPFLRTKASGIIAEEVRNADRVIVRTCGFWPSTEVLKTCRKYYKPYLIEAIEFPFEMRWNSNIINKIRAPYAEITARREIARAPYVVYVSQNALQKRYPSHGKTLACSDVELQELDPVVLEKRISSNSDSGKIIFGTAAGISRLKGQEYVVRAIAELRNQGITSIEYHLAGDDSKNYLHGLIHKLNLQDCVRIFGPVPHEKIFDWYDHLDAYIQPSFTESFGRSVVEAMSRALPAACAEVGGMKEYASSDLFFQPGNVAQICDVMKKLLDPEIRKREAAYSFTKAKEFEKSRLDPIRDKFYMDFMNGN